MYRISLVFFNKMKAIPWTGSTNAPECYQHTNDINSLKINTYTLSFLSLKTPHPVREPTGSQN